jgi:tRNA splicing endonuclease
MNNIKRFNSFSKNESVSNEEISKKEEIKDFIEKNKKDTSSYEMYKKLRDKGFDENDLDDYFYDNY